MFVLSKSISHINRYVDSSFLLELCLRLLVCRINRLDRNSPGKLQIIRLGVTRRFLYMSGR